MAFFQMAVAAAIGVGEGEEDVIHQRLASATSRLSGKRSLLRSSGMSQQSAGGAGSSSSAAAGGLSEINRSIEKMTLQPMNNGGQTQPRSSPSNHSGSCKTTSGRRDSDWTSVSTEDPGYGSMRSDLGNLSRRGSELSQVNSINKKGVSS